MGLLRSHLYLLGKESKRYPIRGNVLVLGQQAVWATCPEVKELLREAGAVVQELPEGFDTTPKIPDWKHSRVSEYTNCQTVLKMLGAENIHVSDISDYEGADIIMDLNEPCDIKYHNQFDVILDSGTLEHIFNLPQALENIHRCCRRGGVIILINPSTNNLNHGFYQICPTLYYDYFEANGYENFTCYLVQGSPVNMERKYKIYRIKDGMIGNPAIMKTMRPLENAFFCRKRADMHEGVPIKIPMQRIYQKQFSEIIEKRFVLKQGKIRTFLYYLRHLTRRWRPEIIDHMVDKIIVKSRVDYVGRY